MSHDDQPRGRLTTDLPAFVGVRHPGFTSDLKRDALLFDRIAIPRLDHVIRSRAAYNHKELEWLRDRGVVYEPRVMETEALRLVHDQIQKVLSERDIMPPGATLDQLHSWPEEWQLKFSAWIHTMVAWQNTESLVIGLMLRDDPSIHSVAVFNGRDSFARVKAPKTPDARAAVHVVLSAMPSPDDETPWEQILDFRADPENGMHVAALRRWLSEVARSALPANEIAEKCEHLLQTRRQYLELARQKLMASQLETILTTTADALDNLLRLRFGALARTLFSLNRADLAVAEAELTAPGSDVAYILAARETFSSQGGP